jgi:hypothetical protein
VHAPLGQQLLHFLGPLVGAVAHRDPGEDLTQQLLLVQTGRERPRREQELELHDRTHGDHTGGQEIRPGRAMFLLQDPEQARGVDQEAGCAHRR